VIDGFNPKDDLKNIVTLAKVWHLMPTHHKITRFPQHHPQPNETIQSLFSCFRFIHVWKQKISISSQVDIAFETTITTT